MADRFLLVRQAGGPPVIPPSSPEYLAENQAPNLLAVTISLYVLATLTVLTRFYVRIFMMKMFGWDGEFEPQGLLSTILTVPSPDVMMTISAVS
jgi:hypothetical protein